MKTSFQSAELVLATPLVASLYQELIAFLFLKLETARKVSANLKSVEFQLLILHRSCVHFLLLVVPKT